MLRFKLQSAECRLPAVYIEINDLLDQVDLNVNSNAL